MHWHVKCMHAPALCLTKGTECRLSGHVNELRSALQAITLHLFREQTVGDLSVPFEGTPVACRTDLEFITKMVDKGAIERLKMVASTPFERCTYTRAIEVLEEAVKGGKKFEFPVSSA